MATTKLPHHFQLKVVGTSFVAGYPNNLFRLKRLAGTVEVPVWLELEPDNLFDSDAVVVCAGPVGKIGHVPAVLAGRVGSCLRAGNTIVGHIKSVPVSDTHSDRPGCVVALETVLGSPSTQAV